MGSTQQFTDYTGGNANDSLFYPFGQLGPQGSGAYLQPEWAKFEDGNCWSTTTGEWQTDTRRYTPGAGRWYTPDPIGKAAARLDDPQTWNMYAYVRNNPTTLTDPSGELFNPLTGLLAALTPFVSEALDAGSYLVKEVTRSRPQPQAGPPAKVVNAGARVYNRPTKINGVMFEGTRYTYKVVDAQGNTVRGQLEVLEHLTATPLTRDVPTKAADWQADNGKFQDYVGYQVQPGGNFPANYMNVVLQNFSAIQGSAVTDLSTRVLQTVSSDSGGNVTGTAVPVGQ